MDTARQDKARGPIDWGGSAGQAWVDAQEALDRMFEPLARLLCEAVAAEGARRVLDVGSGTGATTVAIARLLESAGSCTGVDISAPMIDAARARAAAAAVPASFVRADAGAHPFEPASFDMVVSRFGVMFFDEPVRAFANLRRVTRAGGALCCIAWRGPDENPFMIAAARAAAPLLPEIELPPADGPGQFAFADAGRVRRLLTESGWSAVDIRPLDVACAFPEPELMPCLLRLGPVGRALAGADEETRARVAAAIRPAFAPYVHGAEVRFTAACWLIGAQIGP